MEVSRKEEALVSYVSSTHLSLVKSEETKPLGNQQILEVIINSKRTRIYIYRINEVQVYDGKFHNQIGSLEVDGYSFIQMFLHTDSRLIIVEGCCSQFKVFNVKNDDFTLM